MATRIVFTRPDGGVSVVCPVPALVMEFHLYGRAAGMLQWTGPAAEIAGAVMPLAAAEDAAVAFVQTRDVPVGSSGVRICDETEIPSSRRFRNCWRRVGLGLPAVDMPLARTQRMNEVRAERTTKLIKSDVDFLKAQEAAAVLKQDALKTYRQKLRDLPATEQPNVDACTTSEQLDAWKPTWPVDPAG